MLNLRTCEGTENCACEKAATRLCCWLACGARRGWAEFATGLLLVQGEGGQLMRGWLSCSGGKQNHPIALIDGPRQGEARLSGSGQRSLGGVWSQQPSLLDSETRPS